MRGGQNFRGLANVSRASGSLDSSLIDPTPAKVVEVFHGAAERISLPVNALLGPTMLDNGQFRTSERSNRRLRWDNAAQTKETQSQKYTFHLSASFLVLEEITERLVNYKPPEKKEGLKK